MAWYRRALAVLVAVLGASVALPTPATATAPTAGACTDQRGITVVVDMSHFGGGVQVRCAPQPVSSGFDALRKAGFAVTGTQRFPGLLCRIDGEPASDPCVNAPPATSYWGYWHAPRGGSWTYSTSGASRRPPDGSVEGWAFGAKPQPRIAPPAPVPTVATTTTRPPAPPTADPPPTTGPAPEGVNPSPGTATTTTPPGPEPGAAATTTSSAETPEDAGAADEAAATDGEAGDDDDGDGDDGDDALAVGSTEPPAGGDGGAGSPAAALLTAAVLAAAVGGGVWWRRRSAAAQGLDRGPG